MSSAPAAAGAGAPAVAWFEETIHLDHQPLGHAQRLTIDRLLLRKRTPFQDLLIFEHRRFGRVLALDGVVQTTEADEFIYHEMLAHVALLAHGDARQVLIVGGGDGGSLREVLRHRIDRVTVVDIDAEVVEACRTLLPQLSNGAFDDPRCALIFADAARFVAEADAAYDVILVDAPDPIGPGRALFSPGFYAACRARLAPGGLLVTQSGDAFLQAAAVGQVHRRLREVFGAAATCLVPVPSYVGGPLALVLAAAEPGRLRPAPAVIEGRYAAAGLNTRYYAPAVHQAAFVLPPYLSQLIDG